MKGRTHHLWKEFQG